MMRWGRAIPLNPLTLYQMLKRSHLLLRLSMVDEEMGTNDAIFSILNAFSQ
jgi:hypothetical protein